MTGELLDLAGPADRDRIRQRRHGPGRIAACRARSLTVPGDISIVGFHDDPDAQDGPAPAHHVRVDRTRVGRSRGATDAAPARRSESTGDRLLLPTPLIVRDSTASRRHQCQKGYGIVNHSLHRNRDGHIGTPVPTSQLSVAGWPAPSPPSPRLATARRSCCSRSGRCWAATAVQRNAGPSGRRLVAWLSSRRARNRPDGRTLP